MLRKEDFAVIIALKKRDVYVKDIAAELGVHPKTVSRALRRGSAPSATGRRRGSKLDPHKATIDRLLGESVWNAMVVLREIQAEGYRGGMTILREYIGPKRALRTSRAQVMAVSTEVGMQVVRRLLLDKLAGQSEIAQKIGDIPAADRIRAVVDIVADSDDWSRLESAETQAARIYWHVWENVPVQFARREAPRVPEEWQVFGSRQSPLSGSPRNAANPANAILNYLYAILEAETRIALLTVGLDPGLGLSHTDQPRRDSLACDVMEPVRPAVDSWLHDFLAQNHFARADFFERADGTVRLSARIARVLADTSPRWAKEVAPVAEWVAATLLKATKQRLAREDRDPLPTPLTQSNRSQGRSMYRRRQTSSNAGFAKELTRTCMECGKKMEGTDRKLCSDKCLDAYRRHVEIPNFTRSGLSKLAALRAGGADPSHGGEAARKRGESNARRAAERADWEKLGLDVEAEKDRFVREILPGLQGATILEIVKATGFSRHYASMVRRGLYMPHPVHYEALATLLGCDKRRTP